MKEIYENQSFGIENFKIKFIRNASILVSGNSLNGKSISLARKLKTGDYVTIFDIENININGKKSQEFKTLVIKIFINKYASFFKVNDSCNEGSQLCYYPLFSVVKNSPRF